MCGRDKSVRSAKWSSYIQGRSVVIHSEAVKVRRPEYGSRHLPPGMSEPVFI